MPGTAVQKKKLGMGMATALVIGNMIGSGVFLLPASLAAFGGISIVVWLFTAAGGCSRGRGLAAVVIERDLEMIAPPPG